MIKKYDKNKSKKIIKNDETIVVNIINKIYIFFLKKYMFFYK